MSRPRRINSREWSILSGSLILIEELGW